MIILVRFILNILLLTVVAQGFQFKGLQSLTQNSRSLLQEQVPNELLLDAAHLCSLSYQEEQEILAAYTQYQQGQVGTSTVDSNNATVLAKVQEPPQQISKPESGASVTIFKYKYSASSPVQLVLAFRGSNNLQDFIINAVFVQDDFYPEVQDFSGFKAHKGFLFQFKSLISEVDPIVEQAMEDGLTLFINGHSLGGALSALASGYYVQKYPTKVQFIGLGTPRAVNPEFASYLDTQIPLPNFVRVKNGKDVVTKVPPRNFIGQEYSHAGEEYHIGIEDDATDEAKLDFLEDHSLDKYIAQLQSNPQIVISRNQ